MKSLFVTLILFVLMLFGITLNHYHIHHVCDEITQRLHALPDVGEDGCLSAVQALNDYWLSRADTIEFSSGYAAVDRISEQTATLLACASCGDRYGYRKEV